MKRHKPMSSRGAAFVLIALTSISEMGCDRPSPNPLNSLPPNQPPWFAERAEQSGLVFTQQSGHRQRFFLPEIMGGGAAVFDMDNDGDLDVFLVQAGFSLDQSPGTTKPPPNQLFRNRGDGTFDDVTNGSGAGEHAGYGMGVACGDYDNDGNIDLYVTNLGSNILLHNDGKGNFTDVTSRAGVACGGWSSSAAFVDIENDGDLDLYVCRYVDWSVKSERECATFGGADYCSPHSYKAAMPDVLYRNNGEGAFSEVSKEAGIDKSIGTGLGVVCADFNVDGLTDIFVANDGMNNILWMNQGDGRFKDMAMEFGCALDLQGLAKAGMGIHAADIDDDGRQEVLIGNMSSETDSLFRNRGAYFQDSTAEIGLAGATRMFTRFGLAWEDFDNDGFLDLYEANGRVIRKTQLYTEDPYAEPNMLFRGSAGGKLREVLPRGGTSQLLCHTSRAAAFGDLDNDGGVDIVVVNRDGPAYLLKNVVPNRGHWIKFRVVEEHGCNAFGAILTMQIGNRTLTREVRSAYSYCASNDPRVHVGMGDQIQVAKLTVRWADGTIETSGPFEADRIVTVKRGPGTTP